MKDSVGLCVFLIVFAGLVFFAPNLLNDLNNWTPADPLLTPASIVPQWYFLPFYAILRSIPNKLGGVVLMFGSVFVLFALPWLDTSPVRSARFRPVYRKLMALLVADVIVLGVVGAHEPVGLWILLGRLATSYYFVHFLVLLPVVGTLERPRPLPASISAPVLEGEGWYLRQGRIGTVGQSTQSSIGARSTEGTGEVSSNGGAPRH